MRLIFNIAFVLLIIVSHLTAEDNRSINSELLKIGVSVAPQKYFVEKIGGEFVDVTVMVAPGAAPNSYEPKPKQMAAITKADLYFAIDVPFERAWLEKFKSASKTMQIVRTDVGIEKLEMVEEGHAHGDENDLHDPHIWLAPSLVKIQAATILNALSKIDPENSAIYKHNYTSFLIEIELLDNYIKEILSEIPSGTAFMVYHPSWGYFAKEYSLIQVAVEQDGKEPKPRQLMSLIKKARDEGIKVLFVQPQIAPSQAQTIAKNFDGVVLTIDPLAENWNENLRRVAEAFKKSMRSYEQ